MVVGLGKLKDDDKGCREQLRLAAGTAVQVADGLKVKKMQVVLPEKTGISAVAVAESIAEGLILAGYRFDKYKTTHKNGEKKEHVTEFLLNDGDLNHHQV